MSKTSNVFVRVEPNTKEEAEIILNQLGLSMSNAVDMFLKQVVIQRGIPFEIKLSNRKPLIYDELTKEELSKELQKGLADIENGNVLTKDEVLENLHKTYNL